MNTGFFPCNRGRSRGGRVYVRTRRLQRRVRFRFFLHNNHHTLAVNILRSVPDTLLLTFFSFFSNVPFRLASMRGMSGAIKDASRAGGDDSPDRSPTSAYVPSSSAPWLAGGAAGNGGGGSGTAASTGSGSFKAPAAGGGGSSWWDKHSATADTQPAASSGWGAGDKVSEPDGKRTKPSQTEVW